MKQKLLVAGLLIAFASAGSFSIAEDKGKTGANEPEPAIEQKKTMEAMSAEFMRKVMETSKKIEAVKKEIDDREREIHETNAEIKALRSQMIEIQKTINRILGEDAELARLAMEKDILWTVMPVLPKPAARPLPAGFPVKK
jgi:peptidoglycan hydrolase CwlO-like protein